MSRTRTVLLLMGVVLSALAIFVLDASLIPLGIAVWLPYIGVVMASLWLPRPWHTYAAATLCSVLTVAGSFVSPPGAEFWLASVNRFVAVAAFWIAAVSGLKARRAKELEKANRALQQEIQRREEMETQLRRSQRQESIGVLAGGIAHDFNNLLTPILMATKLLQEERPDSERRQLVGTLQASAERAAELVRNLLAYVGGVHGERTVVEVKDVIREIKQIVEHTFPKAIQIRTAMTGDLLPVLADATQLSQVLMNLCVNARDAMPSGGRLSLMAKMVVIDEVHARAHPDASPGTYVQITVEDSGTGMDPKVLDAAFDPFFTTKKQGKGSGLGLSTSLGIVRSHGGFLEVDSEVGQGSRFAVYLRSHVVAPGRREVPAKRVVERGNGELILVVDDEASTLETVKAVLEHHGYSALTARDGAEALEIYDRHYGEVRAVLLDMMMPEMDGIAVMTKLRERDPKVGIIASSGLCLTGSRAEAVAASQIPFLPKPYTDERLLGVLGKVLLPP